jgi:thiamine biosynthesis lipoprotein
MKRAIAALLIAAAPSIALAATTRAQMLMGTICQITVPDESARAIDLAFAEGKRIDDLLSTWRDDTPLARLNHGDESVVSAELFGILNETVEWTKKTGGAFNPLVAPLIDAWQIRGNGAIPTAEALKAAREKAELANVELTSPHGVVLKNGAAVDPGGFGKGYAIDRMLDVLKRHEATFAQINFGGQIGVYGDQPFVTVADPNHRDKPFLGVLLTGRSISTSSGSEKSFTVDGRTFTHIVDPRTGEALPPWGSVSVIAKRAFMADMLSTALYVMGPDKGLEWAKAHNINAIFITADGKVLTSGTITSLEVLGKEK